MKMKARMLPDKLRVEILDSLYTAAGTVHGRQAMKLFLRDLLTESERIMLGRRIIIARRLIAGDTYDSIEADLRVGRDTIWRVQKWLADQVPGYEDAITKLEKEFSARNFRKRYKSEAAFRMKYPLGFLFEAFTKRTRPARKSV